MTREPRPYSLHIYIILYGKTHVRAMYKTQDLKIDHKPPIKLYIHFRKVTAWQDGMGEQYSMGEFLYCCFFKKLVDMEKNLRIRNVL